MNVSERAVFARLKRYYRRKGLVLHRCRDDEWIHTTGRYAVSDPYTNGWVDYHVPLEDRAREVGVLLPAETVAD